MHTCERIEHGAEECQQETSEQKKCRICLGGARSERVYSEVDAAARVLTHEDGSDVFVAGSKASESVAVTISFIVADIAPSHNASSGSMEKGSSI